MPKRQLAVVGIILIALTILFTAVTFRQEAQDKSQTQQNKPIQDEATVVQKGQVTDEERAFSKEFDKLYPRREKNKLSNLRKEIKDLGITIGTIGDVVDISDAPRITSAEFLNSLSCDSDTIITGYITSKSSHLAEDETFVYTQYEITVDDVLKNSINSSIKINQNLKITRPGGVIKLDDRTITVRDERYEPLQTKKKYLLFLRSVPSADGYIVSSPNGDFIIEDKSFRKISKVASPDELRNGFSTDLLDNVHKSILIDCKQTSKGGN